MAGKLGISEAAAQGRIVAEIRRNSDQQTAHATGGKHDYEIRSLLGCQHLNCKGDQRDPHYADHDYNRQHIAVNQMAYEHGQQQLGQGQTYNDLVSAHIKQNSLGSALAGAGMVGLGLATGGPLASAGMMVAGAALGMGANGGVQLGNNQPFDWTSFALAGGTGAVATGMKFAPVFLTGAGGALMGAAAQGQNPNGALAGAAVGTAVGYPLGAQIKGSLNAMLNPSHRQEWRDMGMGILKYVPPSAIPSWAGDAIGGTVQEKISLEVQNKIDKAGEE